MAKDFVSEFLTPMTTATGSKTIVDISLFGWPMAATGSYLKRGLTTLWDEL